MRKGIFLLAASIVAAAILVFSCAPAAKPASPQPSVQPSVPDAPPANQLEAQVERVYASAAPSVVNITNQAIAYDLFMQAVPQTGTGSGFVYNSQGMIVTNDHVIANAQTLTVTLASGQTYRAAVVGADPTNDLAVIRVRAQLPGPLPIGDSSSLRVGQFVCAIGNPFGLQRTLTFGVISSLGRIIQSPNGRFIGEAIQTDAPINPGNSGGPLLDLEGRVIGVNSQIISPSGANSGIGFAVSAATIQRVVPVLISKGRYPHPWLGLGTLDLSGDLAQLIRQAGERLTVDSGVYVAEVYPNGPAARAGIRGGSRMLDLGNLQLPIGGDVITAINGQPIASYGELTVYLEEHTSIGETVTVTIIRNARKMDLKAVLAERPAQQG
jgi:S1-C subfamily serine protease